MAVNNLYHPWRAILSMINQCLTSKTSRHDRPRYPVLQMLWGIIMSTNFDYVELLWEEFVQAIHTFLTNKANMDSPTKKGRKDKPHVILFCRFTKLIIYRLGRIHDIHQRSTSSFHLAEEELRLGNLKFFPKGEVDEVFGMPIPNKLISNNIKNAPYYNAYLEMVAKHDRKCLAEKKGTKKTASAKQPKPMLAIEKSTKLAPAPKPKATKERLSKASTAKPPKSKPAKEKSTKTTPPQKAKKGKIAKVQKVRSPFQLVDEPDEEPAQSEPEPELEHQGEVDEDDMEIAIQMKATQPLHVVKGKGKVIITKEQVVYTLLALHTPKRRSTTDQFIFQRRTPAIEASSARPYAQAQDNTSANIVSNSPSPADAKTSVASEKTNSGGDIEVQEILKFSTDEHVILEDPMSSTESLSSIKNLEGAYAIGDQFINEKSTKDELEKPNVEAEVVSMVTILIYQASSLVSPLSTLNLESRVFNLELKDLPHKIDEAVRESMREAVHRMFETDTCKSLPEHVTIYEALEASMERGNRDELLTRIDKSRKRRHDDQDPPPPPPDLDLTWKKSDTRDAPPSSSKQQSNPHAEQPRPEWLKPIPVDERPATPEPVWVIPSSYIPDAVNNWANALATTYQAPAKNSLMEECHKMLTDQIEWANLEGDQVKIEIREHLPLSSPPGHVTICQTPPRHNHEV
nr:histone deacetylase 14 [Tanacetum cinerariifolium]